MPGRVIAIADIHGCSNALASIIDFIGVSSQDTIITLGDYVDRGHNSKGVLDQLISLENRCHLVPILGNHDQMLLRAKTSRSAFRFWMNCGGGVTTLDSYGDSGRISQIPATHFHFLRSCVPYFESETHFFTHAGYRPSLSLGHQDDQSLRWRSLHDGLPKPHRSGKTAVVGHTPNAEVLNAGHLLCIDTGCCDGGWLTAVEVENGEIWQVDERGQTRKSRLRPLVESSSVGM